MTINEMIAEAIKSKNLVRLNVLRMIKSEFVKKEKSGSVLTDQVKANILLKMISQREDSIAQFKKANRMDLCAIEQSEIDVLKEFAPEKPSDEEIIVETNRVISELNKIQEVTIRDMGHILSEVRKKYPTANGGIVASIIKGKK